MKNGAIRDRIKELRRVKASELRAHPKNWRVHPDHQRRAMEGVLAEIGYADALLARELDDGTLEIIDGHLRAETTPDAMVPVLVLDVDEKEADLLLATHDPLAAMAQTDIDIFTDLAQDIAIEDESVKGLLEAVANGEMSPMPFPEPEREEADPGALLDQVEVDSYKPFTKPGDIWQLGDHRLMCGDAPDDVPIDWHPDLVLTDPPYGVNIVKGLSSSDGGAKPFGRVRQPGGRPSGVLKGKVGVPGVVQPRTYFPITNDDKPFDPTWLLSVGANQIIFGVGHFASKLVDGTAWLIWAKNVSEEATFSAFELAWTSFKGRYREYRLTWSGMIRAGERDEELKDRVHPTQKPVGLFARIIEDFTNKTDVIFDPYVGSGTTVIAAEKLGRRCYAMEIEPRYCDVAIRRWEDYTGRKAELTSKGVPNGP